MDKKRVADQPSASDPRYLEWLKERKERVDNIRRMRDRR